MHSTLSICVVLIALGQQATPEADAAKALADQRLAFMKKSAAEYRFQMRNAKAGEVTLHSAPLLRWDNQVVEEVDAALFLWKVGQRPVAAAQLFLNGGKWHHEFQSLSPADQEFEATSNLGQRWSWTPNKPGLEFRAAEIDPPIANGALRLRQMRDLARQFTAACDPSRSGRWSNPHALRLLTTPVYRFSEPSVGIVDGTLFTFAQGTNPEVLIQIEAVRAAEGGETWRYAFAPMTSFQVKVHRDDKLVWELPMAPVPTPDPRFPYQFRYAVEKSAE